MNTESATKSHQEGLKDGFIDAMIISENLNQQEDIDFFRVYTKYRQCCGSFDLFSFTLDYTQGYPSGFDLGILYLNLTESFN